MKVAENLDDTTCNEIPSLNLPGVGMQPTNARYYPMGSIAAHILGGVGKDGHGLEGLELKFDKILAGRDGWERMLKDARHRPISIAADDYLPAQHGQHLILTIDANIQMIAEQELAGTCQKFKAKRGEVVVMDPKTGEVLALANWPTFNPQNLEDSTEEVRRNRVVTDPYEPGSTIKPFIAGPALQWARHATRMRSGRFPEKPTRRPTAAPSPTSTATAPFRCGTGWSSPATSSCRCSASAWETHSLHQALSLWGYGLPTGIELPGEDAGRAQPAAPSGPSTAPNPSRRATS